MSGCTPRSAPRITVPKMANSKLTAKQSSVPMNVTSPTRTGVAYQRGARDVGGDVTSSASILMVGALRDPVRAVAAKRVDGSRSRFNLTAMPHPAGDEAFLSRADRGSLIAAVRRINDQCVAPLHHNHVFVELVHMRRRGCCLGAGPERHLASIRPVKHIPFDSGSRLTARGDPVDWLLHELREVFHDGGMLLGRFEFPHPIVQKICERGVWDIASTFFLGSDLKS